MDRIKLQIGFFIVLFSAVAILAYFIFESVLTPVFLAMIVAIIFEPIHRFFEKKLGVKKYSIATVSTVVAVVVILIPIGFFGYLVFKESFDLYNASVSGQAGDGVLVTTIERLEGLVNEYIPEASFDVGQYVQVEQYTRQGVSFLAQNLGGLFSGFLTILLGVFVMIFTLFYIFKDGDSFLEATYTFSPLEKKHAEKIVQKIKLAVNSVIRGHIIIAILQGLLSGVGLWIFGVPSPAVWGFVAGIGSFIPNIGTGIVMVPAVLYLFFTSGPLVALGMALWAIIVVGFVDNLIGPYLIERGIKIHPLIILLSVLGGLHFFGPIGFIAGPIVVAVIFALLEMYPIILKSKSSDTHAK